MYSSRETAEKYVAVGREKGLSSWWKLLILGIFSGVFIALAGAGANMGASLAGGAGKIISALIFPVGLFMVVMTGAELFTGNMLMVITALQNKLSWTRVLRCWLIVYVGNFIGSVAVAFGIAQCQRASSSLILTTLQTAAGKLCLDPLQAVVLGVFCNFLVCIAVWIAMMGASVTEKLAGLYGPIFLFVLSGFEHSIANMYFIPAGIFAIQQKAGYMAAVQLGLDMGNMCWSQFLLGNLLPVTIGNIIGGAVFVGWVCWYIYLRNEGK